MAVGDVLISEFVKFSMLRQNGIDFLDDAMYVALFDSSYVPAYTHIYYTSLTGELSDGNVTYPDGGKLVENKSFTFPASAVGMTWNDITFVGLDAGAPAVGVLYGDTGWDKLIVCSWELGGAMSNGGDYKIQFPSPAMTLVDG